MDWYGHSTMTTTGYSATNNATAADVPIGNVLPSENISPSTSFDEAALQELAGSIKALGLLEPLVVRRSSASPPGAPVYELLAGERRLRACRLAGIETVPVRILEGVDDKAAVRIDLVENLQM